jgi:hypothetical protein
MKNSVYLSMGADLSACGRYRYRLWREWSTQLPILGVVGLNPSTADASKDDHTIRRCVSLAKANGYGRLEMLNLWAFRATDPSNLPTVVTEEEQHNTIVVHEISRSCARMVAAWSSHPKAALRLGSHGGVREWWCFGVTKDGSPRHPSRLPNGVCMVRWPECTA